MRAIARSAMAKRDIKTRQHLIERSFVRGKRYGYDRSRWRGLWRVQIQEYITAGNTEHTSASEIRKGPSQEGSNSYSRTMGRNERKYSCMFCLADEHITYKQSLLKWMNNGAYCYYRILPHLNFPGKRHYRTMKCGAKCLIPLNIIRPSDRWYSASKCRYQIRYQDCDRNALICSSLWIWRTVQENT